MSTVEEAPSRQEREADVAESRQAIFRYARDLGATQRALRVLGELPGRHVEELAEAWRQEVESGKRLEFSFIAACHQVIGLDDQELIGDEVMRVLARQLL